MGITKSTQKSSINLENPFNLTALIYLTLAIFGALGSFLTISSLLPIRGITWIRVHLITLGVIIQFLYGYLPKVVASKQEITIRWDIWTILNIGILTFLTGRYLQNQTIMLSGGIILFVATMIFTMQIYNLARDNIGFDNGSIFYITGLLYFFVGIIMGTGIWLNWQVDLHVGNILEVHIHANNWGLLSFVFAGLFIDKYEDWFNHELEDRSRISLIYWLLVFGAFGLIVGPWIGSLFLIVSGLVFHLIGTVMVVILLIRPLFYDHVNNSAITHLLSGYLWFFAPVFVAPLVLIGVPGIPGGVVEQMAPEALIFGWALQITIFIFYNPSHTKNEKSFLNHNFIALVFINLGGVFLWISIFTSDIFYSLAYLMWAIAISALASDGWKKLITVSDQ